MKSVFKYIIAFLVILPLHMSLFAGANDYRIMRLAYAEGVTIDGIQAKEGNTFSKKSIIQWGNNNSAAMLVKEIATSKLYKFSKRQFDSKGKIRTLQEFFLRTSQTSTRNAAGEVGVTVKRCDNRFSYGERRVALVIGNAAYTSLPSLQNPLSDAAAVTDKLLSLGFDVVETFDCNYSEFVSVLNQFEQIVKQNNYQTIFFYYAGHGIQKDGKNYLVPVAATLQKPSDISRCIGCDDVLYSLEKTSSKSRIVIFDACRNFSSALSSRETKGLAQIQQLAPGTMLIYSTGFGQVASDGDGEHSPFAQALLGNIGKPAVNFELEMKAVARETYSLTNNLQYPAIAGSLTENLILCPGTNNTSPTTNSRNYRQTSTVNRTTNAQVSSLVAEGKKACKTFKYAVAYRKFLEAANMNDMEGCYQLGMLYRNDNFDGADVELAIDWLTKAANMGHADAMFNLGELYLGRDNATAKQWFRKAAVKGHDKAADRLRRMR